MNTFQQHALRHSADAFFNSFVRDMNPPYDPESKTFVVKLTDAELRLPVKNFSRVGLHLFNSDYQLVVPRGSRVVGFLEAAECICHQYESPLLYKRLQNSVHNMATALELRHKTISALTSEKIDFLSAEQALFLGHNVHPTPKSRDEFSHEDMLKYAPEFGARFTLNWLYVDQRVLWEERSQAFAQQRWQQELYHRDAPVGFVPYPVHPWQRQVLLQDPIIQQYMQQGLIRAGQDSSTSWSATSSLRSLYNPDSRYMLKFSLSLRLTNSIRHLQPKEVTRGMQIHDIFQTPAGREFSTRFPQFRVMQEPACMAIKDPAGYILPQTMVLLRENPFRGTGPFSSVVLATLNQEHPLEGKNLLATYLTKYSAHTWFDAFLNNAVTPLLIAQADYGLMLGAHQQNLLLELKDGLPVGSYFRDCQGTAISELGAKTFAMKQHLVPQEAARDLFGYYLVINSVFSTIAAIARASGTDEKALLLQFRQSLQGLRSKVRDPYILDYWLNAEVLKQKGNFRCGLSGLNENTTEDPLSIYNTFPNPFHASQL